MDAQQVCLDCANEWSGKAKSQCHTCVKELCDICGRIKLVTSTRNFRWKNNNYPQKPMVITRRFKQPAHDKD